MSRSVMAMSEPRKLPLWPGTRAVQEVVLWPQEAPAAELNAGGIPRGQVAAYVAVQPLPPPSRSKHDAPISVQCSPTQPQAALLLPSVPHDTVRQAPAIGSRVPGHLIMSLPASITYSASSR
jgi:hypothetical protein